MRKSLLLLSSLALAATAAAQTASLVPTARGGFESGARSSGWIPSKTFRTWLSGGGTKTTREGWAAEYDLSALPFGARIVSATLASTLSGLSAGDLALGLRGYVGNGTAEPGDMDAGSVLGTLAPAAWTAGRLDVAAALQARLDARDRYAGFSLAPLSGSAGRQGLGVAWSAPALNVVYTVDHGLAKTGWPMSGRGRGNAHVGGPARATGVVDGGIDLTGSPAPGLFYAKVTRVGPNGWVYVVCADSSLPDRLIAYDASGVLRWSRELPNREEGKQCALSADGTLYVSADHLYAFDAATGGVRWEAPGQGQIYIQEDGTILLVGGGAVVAYDWTGALRWTRTIVGQSSSVQAGDGTLVIRTNGGRTLDFRDPQTGTLIDQCPVSGTYLAGLCVREGKVAWTSVDASGPPRHSYTTQPYRQPGNPPVTIHYQAATTTQDWMLKVWTVPVGGSAPVSRDVKAYTTRAVAPYATRSVFPNAPAPALAHVSGIGQAPNGDFVLAFDDEHETLVARANGIDEIFTPSGDLAISQNNVLYINAGGYDLTTRTWLWRYEFLQTERAFEIAIGPSGEVWYSYFRHVQRFR